MLSYIASRLASTRPVTQRSCDSGGSGSLPALAQWQVDWDDIKLERQIGRGSAGRVSAIGRRRLITIFDVSDCLLFCAGCSCRIQVYRGYWSGIQVAVKV